MGWRPRRRTLVWGAAAGVTGAGALAALELTGQTLDGCDDAARIGARFESAYGKKAEALGAASHTPEWETRVGESLRKDLEAGNLVEVDGWWLAETELLVCVLIHRARSDRGRFGSPRPC